MPSEPDWQVIRDVPLGAIEGALARMNRRPRGQGVTLPGMTVQWEGNRTLAGYAIPVKLSIDAGFPNGKKENLEWWRNVQAQPGPKIVVAQMVSKEPGAGAACGALTAHILKSLGCDGFLTDGYVRDLEQIAASGLMVASRGITLRHGTPHVVGFGEPVEVFGMRVAPGDVVLAGREGALAFPAEWSRELPARIREVDTRLRPVMEFVSGKRRTADEIAAAIAEHMPQPKEVKTR